MGAIYDVLVGAAFTNSPYTATISSFIDALKDANPGSAAAIDALCALHGISAVADGKGTGESNSGTWTANLPVYSSAAVDGAVSTRTTASGSTSPSPGTTRPGPKPVVPRAALV